jgi:uncharacterized protein YcfJ
MRRYLGTALLVTCTAFLAPSGLTAQARADSAQTWLAAGSVVRLTVGWPNSVSLTGTVLGADADTVRVRPLTSFRREAIPLHSISQVELQTARPGQRGLVAAGALLGAVIGGTIAYQVSAPSVCGECRRPRGSLGAALTAGALSALVGGLIGARLAPRQWTAVALRSPGT